MLWQVKVLWYRLYQAVFMFFVRFMPWRQPELVEGADSVLRLPERMTERNVKKALLVTGPHLRALGVPDPLLAAMKAAGIEAAVFSDVEANPSVDTVEAARKRYLDEGCDAIVAFGGGSPMDCAKVCGARIARPDRTVQQLGGLLRVGKRIPPLFAIPTTAGTGSETTVAAVVTDRATRHKYGVSDFVLIPVCAALDPLLTVGLPPAVTAATGMDALTHAVEAFINRHTTAATDAPALEAVRLIFQNLETAYRDGANVPARMAMLKASYLAGTAFTRACVGYVHAIAHTLGGLYGTPHGLANAVILPVVLEDYGEAVHPRLARLAEAVGLQGETDAEKARAFLSEIRRMNAAMGIPDHFDCIDPRDLPQMLRWALAEANPTYPVPVIWDEAHLLAVITKIRGK